VDLAIGHQNPVAARTLLGTAPTFVKYKAEQKYWESVDSCGRMGVDFSLMVYDIWGGPRVRGRTW